MSNERITVDRQALFEVVDFYQEDAASDFLATPATDKPCHIFLRLQILADDLAAAEKRKQEVFEL